MRINFQFHGRYAQFSSLPSPNAQPERATECQARLVELMLINKFNSRAKVVLCINNQTIDAANHFQGKRNATFEVRARTLAMAKAMQITTYEHHDPSQVAEQLLEMAK